MKKKFVATISGYVQGVGYRYFAQKEAQKLSLAGYVKNIYSGKVEVLAEGEEASLDKFKEKLIQGPFGSNVVHYEFEDQPFVGEYKSFEIN